jgi:hypothetical protein
MIQAEARSKIEYTIDEQLHLLIRNFNYREQQNDFEDMLGVDQVAQAVLVRIDHSALQKWLVWRLVQKFHEIEGRDGEKPFRLSIKATRRWQAQPEILWQWLAESVDCREESPDLILDAIAQMCKLRSVVIAIHEASQIKPGTWDYLLQEFWQPLSDRLNQNPCGIRQRRCLLFLSEHAEYNCPKNMSGLVELSAWKKVQEADWRRLLRNRQVQDFLNRPMEEQELLSMPLDKPQVMIQGLGQAAGLEHGIEEMVHHWNLETA